MLAFGGHLPPVLAFGRSLRNVFIPLLKCGLTPSACLPLHSSDPSCNPAGRLQSWLRCWRVRAQVAARQRLQMERAELHHRWRALWQALAAWKIHHHGCARKKVRLLEGTKPSPRTLSSWYFRVARALGMRGLFSALYPHGR